MSKAYDYLIVGSGLFGATIAYRLRQSGKTCLVVDKRLHTGGNVYCENVGGVHVHKYGAHIFHTNDDEVWRFVTGLVEFNRYTNSPVANYHGKLYNLPFNMNTFYQMWGVTTPEQAMSKIEEQKHDAVEKLRREGADEPRNLEEQAQILIGKDIYERLIKGYTEKQWGRKCTELPAFIIRRLPVRLTFDNNYFNAKYQGIPYGGYNQLIDRLLSGVEVRTGVDFTTDRSALLELADKVVYTGALDEYFDFRYGKLEYRTVRFETEDLSIPNYQGNAVVNYTDAETPYTRIIEHKHFEMFGQQVYDVPHTVISREFSSEWKPGMEPYYPVNDDRNNTLYAKYAELAQHQDNVVFGGRLAEYKYYDMDQIILRALHTEL